jgi:hypothetical protein
LLFLFLFVFIHMCGNIPIPYGPCPFCYEPYHNVRNCPSLRQISNDIFGHKNTPPSQPGNDRYSDSSNPTWSQQSNLSWQAQFPGNPAPQFYDHSYSYPYQQYQEEPPSQTMAALKETMAASEEIMAASTEASARLERTMLAFLSEAEEDRQEFARINNSITQSYEKMDVHFKQMMDILKEEKCQGQLVANLNEYYMENECIYYHEQTTTTPRNEETVKENFCEPSLEDPLGEHFDQFCEQAVVENQVDEMKEEQIEDLEEPHQEKEESTKTFSTLALIPETPRAQERSLLELPNEQIEDIKIEKLPESSSYFIPVQDEKLFEKTQNGPPLYTDNWNPFAMGRHHSLWCKKRKDWCFKFKVPKSG